MRSFRGSNSGLMVSVATKTAPASSAPRPPKDADEQALLSGRPPAPGPIGPREAAQTTHGAVAPDHRGEATQTTRGEAARQPDLEPGQALPRPYDGHRVPVPGTPSEPLD